MTPHPDPRDRSWITPGMKVEIILKQDQRTGRRTPGIVQEILTGSKFHPHGIKVRLTDGRVGRVAGIHVHSDNPAGGRQAPASSPKKSDPEKKEP